jgi:hypothetical protein
MKPTHKVTKKFDLNYIRSFNPCYDPIKYLDETWEGTILDIVKNNTIPFEDVLWLAMRTDFVSERLMRIFAVWCARQVQHLMKDQRSVDALDFMDAYIEHVDLIDDDDWRSGWENNRDAVMDAARDVAWDAVMDAAWAAARDAVMAAAWAAARDAVMDAAWASARDTARDAVMDAARDAQRTKLIEMIEDEQ